jgi:hypothetical protein
MCYIEDRSQQCFSYSRKIIRDAVDTRTWKGGKPKRKRGKERKKENYTNERKEDEKAKAFVLQCLAESIKLRESEIPFRILNNRCSEKFETLYSVDRRS